MGILLTSGGQVSFGPGGRLRLAVPTGARTSVLQARGAVKHQWPKGHSVLDGPVRCTLWVGQGPPWGSTPQKLDLSWEQSTEFRRPRDESTETRPAQG